VTISEGAEIAAAQVGAGAPPLGAALQGPPVRRALDLRAIVLVLLLCVIWSKSP
jgi:hypothetical protein